MSAIKLKENLYSVGVLNPSLRVFDIVMEARYGTSYNAYLITGEKNVLVETVEANFFDEYLDNIQSVVDISKIDYLIMNHTEPDHSGSVAKLLEKNPNITVVCTTAAQKYLRAIANHDFPCIVAKHGDKLDIGGQEAGIHCCAAAALAGFHVHLDAAAEGSVHLRLPRRTFLRAHHAGQQYPLIRSSISAK